MHRRILHLSFLVAIACHGSVRSRTLAIPPTWPHAISARAAHAPHGMVVSDQALASHVGAEVLAAGGNAIDAVVATAFALAVVLPEAGNLGGGGFAVVRLADGQTAALDFREMAPAAATRDMYIGPEGMPTKDSLWGPRASGIPGSVAGLAALHSKYGTRPWRELVAPAIQLAEDGFPVDARLREGIESARGRLETSAASAALYLPGGGLPALGALFKNPELGRTLRRIAEAGGAGFYEGETAELIVAEMARSHGLITKADLAGYQAKWRQPIDVAYRGHRIIAMPLPSSGGIVIAMVAKLLAGFDLPALGWHSPDHLTLLAEAEQRAFADRNRYLGDPDFASGTPDLLSDAYAARRRATIDMSHATPSVAIKPGFGDGDHTTHMAVVDGQGGAVSLTTTINELYGSGVTIPGAGFLMNDEMDDFTVKPGAANLFGLIQGEANRIEPGKRPLSSMSPTIVLGVDGRVRLLAGGRGGSRIISATLQVISNVVDFDLDVVAAVSAPRIHHQHLPDILYYEPAGLSGDTRTTLQDRGFKVETMPLIANSPAILRVSDGWSGFADPRRGGGAEGY